MKKWMGGILFASLLATGVAAPNSDASAAAPTGWSQTAGHWYYYTASGKYTGWLLNGSKWYYLDGSGVMKTGWVFTGGKWYYLTSSGTMATGWLKDGNAWYYLDKSGAMKTGWLKDGNAWYYLDKSGAMKTGWLKDGNAWYYLDESGAMKTDWLKDGNAWYYLNKSGAMKTGWLKDGNATYYLDKSGAMKTGWQTIGGKQYYFATSGAMAHDTTIDGKTLGSDGAVVQAPVTPLSKAINDAKAIGATVTPQRYGVYSIYLNGVYIGDLDTTLGYVDGDDQYASLFEKMAIDIGFNANPQELASLVDQVKNKGVLNLSVMFHNNTLFISLPAKVSPVTPAVSKALSDISTAGAVAKPVAQGFYNIFKANEYVGNFSSDAAYSEVDGNGQYADLLKTIALDLGYNGTSDALSSDVQQAMSKANTIVNSCNYDGYTLSISWDPMAAAVN